MMDTPRVKLIYALESNVGLNTIRLKSCIVQIQKTIGSNTSMMMVGGAKSK